MAFDFLLYGSYGYTGGLIAELAVEGGLRPLLAGRDPVRLSAQAQKLGLEYRAFGLEDKATLEGTLKETPVVMHCAGPYRHTYQPVVEACLATGTHYVDLTGELVVFEALAALDGSARAAGVMLLPGAGFDVVPSDCLAAHLKQRLPTARRLELAIMALGSKASHGTMLSAVESLPRQGLVLKDGKLVRVPLGWKTRRVDFGKGAVRVVCLPVADVFTAYHSTGIPNIETYYSMPPLVASLFPLIRILNHGLGWRPLKGLLRNAVRLLPSGTTAQKRTLRRCQIWGEVSDEHNRHAVARLETPEAYQLTAQTALGVVQKILAGDVHPGFQTPARAYGPDFILEFAGVRQEDL